MAKVDKQELYRLQALPLDEKIAIAQKAIREFVEHFGVDGIYISFSGGKDSTVLIHLCRQLYPDLVGLYSDTGLEFPEIRDFVQTFDNITIVTPKMHHREMLKKCGYPVVSKEQAEWIYRIRSGTSSGAIQKAFYGLNLDGTPTRFKLSEQWKYLLNAPFNIGSGCCKEMKLKPIAEYVKKTGRVPIMGTTASESALRAQKFLQYGFYNLEGKKAQCTPMSIWTDDDVWEYIHRFNLPYCKIYDIGYDRTGCVFCMFGAHLDKEPNRFQKLQRTHPDLWRYCMKPYDDGGLGLREVLEFMGIPYENYLLEEE
ncbi:MAG: phosphoadenosine phosphosulfate reductase family protein [Christensenellaceae bacterium]|nr:phosphoadenosine phosphosulfate reductase family protein [Christensenellaceae bacterium]